jgi:hypothetical protein
MVKKPGSFDKRDEAVLSLSKVQKPASLKDMDSPQVPRQN